MLADKRSHQVAFSLGIDCLVILVSELVEVVSGRLEEACALLGKVCLQGFIAEAFQGLSLG